MNSFTYAVRWLRRFAPLFAAAGFALAIAGTAASAQVAKWAAPAAAETPAADAKKRTQWVKLCDKITINADAVGADTLAPKDHEDGKPPATETKELCSTTFEAIESNTGQLVASVRLEEIEGASKQALAVTVPLGVVIPAGVKLAVYNADQWARSARNETIGLKDLKTVGLQFSHCLPIGCTAEAQATEEVSELLKSNSGVAVLAIWTNGNQLAVPVPLSGFADALAGKPVDNREYSENRRKLMDQIRQRQIELANKAKLQESPPDNMDNSAAPAAPAAQASAPASSPK